MTKNLNAKLSRQLSGISGEYYAAGELCRRGYLAAITLRNAESIDILARSVVTNQQISVQVKTTQNKRKWLLSSKVEDGSEKKIYIFVNLPKDLNSRPEFFLISSTDLSELIKSGHQKWLNTLGKNGQPHSNKTNVRQFSDVNGKYLENWSVLEEFSIFSNCGEREASFN